MSQKFPWIIEECLNRLDRGEDLLEVLDHHPQHQQRLKLLLLVAMASRALPPPVPSHTAQRLGKNKLLEEMEFLRVRGAFRKNPKIPAAAHVAGNLVKGYRARGFYRLAPSYRLAALAAVLFLSGGYLTLTASASSQPSDLLSALKAGLERVQQILPGNLGASQPLASQAKISLDDLPDHNPVSPPRTTDWSFLVLDEISFQPNPNQAPGSEPAGLNREEPLPPAVGSAQTDSGEDISQEDEGDDPEAATASSQAKENKGKALGKIKSNSGQAQGKNKPKQEKPKNKK